MLKQLVNLFQMWTNVLRIQPFVKTASFVTIHLDRMFVEVNFSFVLFFCFFLGGREDLVSIMICLSGFSAC